MPTSNISVGTVRLLTFFSMLQVSAARPMVYDSVVYDDISVGIEFCSGGQKTIY